MDAAPPPQKTLRDGRYVLLAPLGQGSQGTTWDAVDKREGRPVAVKAFDVRGARAWKDVELAEREARVLSELDHPALPRYIEHFEEEGVLYLVMEKVPGTPLSALYRKGACMGEGEALRLLRDADEALRYLHERTPPVIHRDLKPSNVIRRTDGSYAFVDFGAVKDHLRPEGGSTVVGTFGYMAPEQFQGRAGPASDVYSVGATVIAMLSGQEPEKLPHRGLSLDVAAALGGRVSPGLVGVLSKMLEPDPDRRPSRIGPLLAWSGPRRPRVDAARGAPRDRQDAVSFGVASAREAARAAREAGRRARRDAKHARREANRAARRERRGRSDVRLPFFVRHLLGAGLTIAQLAVILALQVVVPLVLTLLSLVFGEGLRRAARAMTVVGGRAGEAIGAARSEVHTPGSVNEQARVRVATTAAEGDLGRMRVAAPGRAGAHEGDALEDEEDLDPEEATARGRARPVPSKRGAR